jgi:hypothetical protein
VYGKNRAGKKHEKEQWEIPDDQHFIHRFGQAGQDQAETDHRQAGENAYQQEQPEGA